MRVPRAAAHLGVRCHARTGSGGVLGAEQALGYEEWLRAYTAGAAYAGGKFDDWDFATGDPAEVRRLAQFFGLVYGRENGQLIHSLRTAVVTPDGRLHKIYRGNDWKPEEVLRELKDVTAKS